jgi:purine-cytosine permease-like protein
MVQIRRQTGEAKGSPTIGRRVGGEIETVGVAPVPDDQRVQTPRQMFIVWLMASASATTPLIGALLFKFGLTDLIIAIVASWLIGFIPAGLFSEMGREVPLSALVVARKTYGWDGSLLFSVLFSVVNLGSTPKSAPRSWPPSRTPRWTCGTWSSARSS